MGSEIGHYMEATARLRSDLTALAEACIAYDAAIQSCANDPNRMASFCTADGDDLDALYFAWLKLARAATDSPTDTEGGE